MLPLAVLSGLAAIFVGVLSLVFCRRYEATMRNSQRLGAWMMMCVIASIVLMIISTVATAMWRSRIVLEDMALLVVVYSTLIVAIDVVMRRLRRESEALSLMALIYTLVALLAAIIALMAALVRVLVGIASSVVSAFG